MAQPFLDLRDVRSIFEGVGRGGSPEGVGTERFDGDADGLGVVHHDVPVDGVRRQSALQLSIRPIDRPEQRAFPILSVSNGIEIVLDQAEGLRMHGQVAELSAFSVDREGHYAPALHEVLDLEGSKFCAAQTVVEEKSQDSPVAFPLQGGRVRSAEELACLVVGDGRCLAFVGTFGWPLDTMDRVDGDGVLLAEVVEEVGERGELPANRGRGEGLLFEGFSPGNDVGPVHHPELGELLDAHELHELADVVSVGPAGVRVGDVGEPLCFGRNVGEPLELRPGEHPFLRWLRGKGRDPNWFGAIGGSRKLGRRRQGDAGMAENLRHRGEVCR